MWKHIARRLLGSLPLIVFVTAVVFLLMEFVPGDPALTIAGDRATLEQVEAIREKLGLNEPLISRYVSWLSGAVTGDLGTSLFSSQSVADSVRGRFPVTVSLAVGSVVVAVSIGVTSGVLAAVRPGSWVDRSVTIFASAGLAIPSFWLGLILVLVFSRSLGWLPPTGYIPLADDPTGWLLSILMPSVALGLSASAAIARQTRSSLVGVLQRDYIVASLARGTPRSAVIAKHGLKNAAIPVVTVLGLQLVNIIAASVIIEHVFALPGLGSLAIQSVVRRDVMMILGVVVATTVIVVVMNLAVDILYGYINPKARTT